MKLGDWIGFFCLILSLIILWQFREIVLLFLTGIILAVALNSLVRWIQKIGIQSRGQAVLLALTLVLLFAILFISVVIPPFLAQFQQLIALAPVGFTKLIRLIDQILESPPTWFPIHQLQLPDLSELAKQIGPVAQNLLENFFAFFSNSLAILLKVLLVIVFTVMLLVDPQGYRKLAIRLFPSCYRRRADDIFTKCETALLQWMAGIVINSIFVATLSGVGLLFLRIQFVYAHALLAGVFNFVPNIGPAASVIFPISVALLDTPLKALAVILLYLIVQNLESYWFSPMVMQKQISLLPAATLAAQIFFAMFLGFLGLVLALPLTVIAKTWIEEAWLKDVLDQWQGERFSPLPRRETLAPMPMTTEPSQPLTLAKSEGQPPVPDPWE